MGVIWERAPGEMITDAFPSLLVTVPPWGPIPPGPTLSSPPHPQSKRLVEYTLKTTHVFSRIFMVEPFLPLISLIDIIIKQVEGHILASNGSCFPECS
jgi:hypothetical protein